MRARSAVWRLVAVGRSIAQSRVLALKRRGRCGMNKLADWAGRVMKRNGRCERDGCGGVGMLCLRVVYVGFDWGISMATGAEMHGAQERRGRSRATGQERKWAV